MVPIGQITHQLLGLKKSHHKNSQNCGGQHYTVKAEGKLGHALMKQRAVVCPSARAVSRSTEASPPALNPGLPQIPDRYSIASGQTSGEKRREIHSGIFFLSSTQAYHVFWKAPVCLPEFQTAVPFRSTGYSSPSSPLKGDNQRKKEAD